MRKYTEIYEALKKYTELCSNFYFSRFQQDFKQAVRDFKGVVDPQSNLVLPISKNDLQNDLLYIRLTLIRIQL